MNDYVIEWYTKLLKDGEAQGYDTVIFTNEEKYFAKSGNIDSTKGILTVEKPALIGSQSGGELAILTLTSVIITPPYRVITR